MKKSEMWEQKAAVEKKHIRKLVRTIVTEDCDLWSTMEDTLDAFETYENYKNRASKARTWETALVCLKGVVSILEKMTEV